MAGRGPGKPAHPREKARCATRGTVLPTEIGHFPCFAAALGRRQQNEAAARMRRPDRSETRFRMSRTARAQPDGDDNAAHPAAPARFRPINRA